MKKNNRAARAARFLVQCFDVVCQTTTREIFIFEVLTTTRARSSKSFILFFYMKTISAKQVQVARHIFCTAFPTWNDHRSLNLTQSSILMSPFRCSCRRSFLNSLLGSLRSTTRQYRKRRSKLQVQVFQSISPLCQFV